MRIRALSTAGAALALAIAAPAAAAAPVQVSSDPYTSADTGRHSTEVEPDSFAAGSTIVAAFQVGRYADGGGANIGWATSTDRGATWSHGVLAGLTSAGGGPYARATDAAVAYDRRKGAWLVNSTALDAPPSIKGAAVVVNRSTDGGITWGAPVPVAVAGATADFDKNWIVCDNSEQSPHYGNCYVEWDDFGDSGRLLMSTSHDGGLTWGPPRRTTGGESGLGGQPVVRPDGTVIVPFASPNETAIGAFRSTDGGVTWSRPVDIAGVIHHEVAGPTRSGPLPSAEIDGSGRVFVAWEDCGARPGCKSNDIVLTSSADGLTWARVRRVPIDPITSGVDHFVPGLGVDPATQGRSAHLGLAYHYMPATSCGASTCQVHVGFVDSLDGGATWSKSVDLAGPMAPNWLAPTADGYMTGDYISTSFSNGAPHPLIAVAGPPSGGLLHEAIFSASPPMRGPATPPAPRRITKLRISPFRFRPMRSGPSIASARGTHVTYRASAAGNTRFALRRSARRHGSRCGPPRADGRPRTCHVWVSVQHPFHRTDRRGKNAFRFSGRAGGPLRAGLYRLIAEPRDPGRPAGKGASARFRIL